METAKRLVRLGTAESVMALPSTNSLSGHPTSKQLTFLIHLCVQLPYTWDTWNGASNWPMLMWEHCFPSRIARKFGVPREIVNEIKILKYRENFWTPHEISQKSLSGIWQYWYNLRTPQTVLLLHSSFHIQGFVGLVKIILRLPVLTCERHNHKIHFTGL
jgi:hypothetical protein